MMLSSPLSRSVFKGLSRIQYSCLKAPSFTSYKVSPTHLAIPRAQQLRTHSHSTSSSADPSEISHFNALASTWWDPHGSSRLLHLMNPLRIQFINSCLLRSSPVGTYSAISRRPSAEKLRDPVEEVVGKPPREEGLTYLDVGCGGGILSESLARLPRTKFVVGVDPSKEILGVARQHAESDPFLYNNGKGKLRYVNTTVDQFRAEEVLGDILGPETNSAAPQPFQFDVLTAMEVIEHVPYPAKFLEACMTQVKPGGWIILSTIARTWTSWVTTKLVAEDILGIVPRGTHDWKKYINEEELRGFFEKQVGWGGAIEGREGSGLKGVVTMGCLYVPGMGWREVKWGERVGNYFFGVRRNLDS